MMPAMCRGGIGRRTVELSLVLMLVQAAGCGANAHPHDTDAERYLDALIRGTPGMDLRPRVSRLKPVAFRQNLLLNDLTLTVPEDWDVEPLREDLKEVAVRAKLPKVEEAVTISYRRVPSMLKGQREELTGLVANFVPDADGLLSRFRSDLQLVSAVRNVVPSDVRTLKGDKLREAQALLVVKGTIRPATERLDSQEMHAFVIVSGVPNLLLADVLDAGGTYRGLVGLRHGSGVPVPDAEQVFRRLLVSGKFRQNE